MSVNQSPSRMRSKTLASIASRPYVRALA